MSFNPGRQIAIIWDIDDVHGLGYNLTDEQAIDVLRICSDNHDATLGITWDTLECAVEYFYPEEYNSKQDKYKEESC